MTALTSLRGRCKRMANVRNRAVLCDNTAGRCGGCHYDSCAQVSWTEGQER